MGTSLRLFSKVSDVHQYHTRSAAKQPYYLHIIRKHYEKFHIRFRAPMIWNSIKEQIKTVSFSKLKLSLKEHCYIILMILFVNRFNLNITLYSVAGFNFSRLFYTLQMLCLCVCYCCFVCMKLSVYVLSILHLHIVRMILSVYVLCILYLRHQHLI